MNIDRLGPTFAVHWDHDDTQVALYRHQGQLDTLEALVQELTQRVADLEDQLE